MGYVVQIEQILEPQGRSHDLRPVLIPDVQENPGILVFRDLAQPGAHALGIGMEDRQRCEHPACRTAATRKWRNALPNRRRATSLLPLGGGDPAACGKSYRYVGAGPR